MKRAEFLREALETLGRNTYREQARRIIASAGLRLLDTEAEQVARLGWLAGEGVGDPPSAPSTESKSQLLGLHPKVFLREVYVEAYRQALESDPSPPFGGQASSKDFEYTLRSPVRGFWTGEFSRQRFIGAMEDAISRGLGQAWREGIAVFGFEEEELAQGDWAELELAVAQQVTGPHIGEMAERIWNNRKEAGGKLSPLLSHVTRIWGNRYNEFFERGKAVAGADRKVMWTLGVAEHCPSCLKLAGKVKRYSYWKEMGVLPRVAGAPYLECEGYQ